MASAPLAWDIQLPFNIVRVAGYARRRWFASWSGCGSNPQAPARLAHSRRPEDRVAEEEYRKDHEQSRAEAHPVEERDLILHLHAVHAQHPLHRDLHHATEGRRYRHDRHRRGHDPAAPDV